jgi:hypothetical protein
VTVEGTMCKTVFASKFIDLFVVVITLFAGGYFHLCTELLSIAHPQYQGRTCFLGFLVGFWCVVSLNGCLHMLGTATLQVRGHTGHVVAFPRCAWVFTIPDMVMLPLAPFQIGLFVVNPSWINLERGVHLAYRLRFIPVF